MTCRSREWINYLRPSSSRANVSFPSTHKNAGTHPTSISLPCLQITPSSKTIGHGSCLRARAGDDRCSWGWDSASNWSRRCRPEQMTFRSTWSSPRKAPTSAHRVRPRSGPCSNNLQRPTIVTSPRGCVSFDGPQLPPGSPNSSGNRGPRALQGEDDRMQQRSL